MKGTSAELVNDCIRTEVLASEDAVELLQRSKALGAALSCNM
jgi:hypothetical protein